jgi:hypothetical protein
MWIGWDGYRDGEEGLLRKGNGMKWKRERGRGCKRGG